MDDNEARAASPIYRSPYADTPHIVTYGLNEPPEMHRQSKEYMSLMSDQFDILEALPVAGADHFETVDVLADEQSELFNRTMHLFTTGKRQCTHN